MARKTVKDLADMSGYRALHYRGYWIECSPFDGRWRVNRDGFTVATCESADAARAAVDSIVG